MGGPLATHVYAYQIIVLSTFNILQLCQLNLNKAAQKEILIFCCTYITPFTATERGQYFRLLLLAELRAPAGLACRVPSSPVKTRDSLEDGALLALLCSIHGMTHTLKSAATQNW